MRQGEFIAYFPGGTDDTGMFEVGFTPSTLVFGPDSKAKVAIIGRPGESQIPSAELPAATSALLPEGYDCRIVAMPGAEVEITEFRDGTETDTLEYKIFVHQSEGSRVSMTTVVAGGEKTGLSCRVRLADPDAEFRFAGLFLASGEQNAEFDVRVDHLAPDCRSDQQIKGIVSGRAVGSFTGRVHVAQDSQRTEAMQQSRSILLSPDAKVYTRPQLEIYADDVKCSHGAAVGQLDEQSVYYMRQRGLDTVTARRLQLEGFASDITARACCYREHIERTVLDKLGEM